MTTIRWNVAVTAETDQAQALRMFLASQGGERKGDLSHFIEEPVRAHILERTHRTGQGRQCGGGRGGPTPDGG